MAQMAKYTPTMVERKFDEHRHILEALDTTDRSLRYFYEYEGKDKAKNIMMLKKQYNTLSKWLENTTTPKSLSTLAKENAEAVVDHVVMMIMEVKKFWMVDRSITSEAAFQVAHLIVSEFPFLTLEELCVCFNQARKGHYGEDYQRLDGPTIMKWMQNYARERQARLAEKEFAKRIQHNAGNDRGRYDHKGDNQTKLREAVLWRLGKK